MKKTMKFSYYLFILIYLCVHKSKCQTAKSVYNMDKHEDCIFAGYLEVPDNEIVTIQGKDSNPTSKELRCTLKFETVSDNAEFELTFSSYYINDCDVILFIQTEEGVNGQTGTSITYSCANPVPGTLISKSGAVLIRLQKRYINDRDYDFNIRVRSYKPDQTITDTGGLDVDIPVVAGIVAGIVVLILIIAVILVCCFKNRKRKSSDSMVDNENQYENKKQPTVLNNEFDSPRSQRKLITNKKSQSKSNQLFDKKENDISMLSIDNPVNVDKNLTETKSSNGITDGLETNKSPLLSALHKNPKFRKSFEYNEEDANSRANRISKNLADNNHNLSSSSLEPTTPPPLPAAHKVKKSPKSVQRHASIKRAYRQSSSSVEEMNLSPDEYDDKHIKLIKNNDEPSSPSEVVPIKLSDPFTSSKPKHTLRPRQNKSISNMEEDETKIHSEYPPESTPTSKRRKAKESESDSPLKRTDSRQSLYASRSSLYGRRSRRERRGSFSESVSTYATYARDDLDSVYDFDDRRLYRRESGREYKSMSDLVDKDEKETQTLRESSTQTAKDKNTVAQPKKYVRNKSMRKTSASSTSTTNAKEPVLKAKQNAAKSNGRPSTTKDESEVESDQNTKLKESGTTSKPKVKPKPVPRKASKSLTNLDTLDQANPIAVANNTSYDERPTSAMSLPYTSNGVVMQPYFPSHIATPVPYPVQPTMYHPNHQNILPTESRVQPTTEQRSKSSWDLLCELTEAEKQTNVLPSDSMSVTDSVFSKNIQPPSIHNTHPIPSQNMLPMPAQNVQTIPMVQNIHSQPLSSHNMYPIPQQNMYPVPQQNMYPIPAQNMYQSQNVPPHILYPTTNSGS